MGLANVRHLRMTELLLVLAGLIAGTLNTLAGGGSFVLFPALLAAGIPPVNAICPKPALSSLNSSAVIGKLGQ